MPEPDSTESSLEVNAESALRAAEIGDLADSAAEKAGRVLVLTIVGIVILGSVLLEATPLVAMAATLVAVLPLKAAIRRFLALDSKKEELLKGTDAGRGSPR